MAERGKKQTPFERDLREWWRITDKYGLKELNRQRPKRARRGRHPSDLFQDFQVEESGYKGVYVVRFHLGNDPMVWIAFVSPKKRWVSSAKITVMTPHQTFRDIVLRLWEEIEKSQGRNPKREDPIQRRLDPRVDTITRQLARKFREGMQALKSVK